MTKEEIKGLPKGSQLFIRPGQGFVPGVCILLAYPFDLPDWGKEDDDDEWAVVRHIEDKNTEGWDEVPIGILEVRNVK